jgi:hypothetical protein
MCYDSGNQFFVHTVLSFGFDSYPTDLYIYINISMPHYFIGFTWSYILAHFKFHSLITLSARLQQASSHISINILSNDNL